MIVTSDVLTTCPRCETEDVKVLAGGDDFKATAIAVSPCQFDEATAVSVLYPKSYVLAAEARYHSFWDDSIYE